jgi:hypothetical protein
VELPANDNSQPRCMSSMQVQTTPYLIKCHTASFACFSQPTSAFCQSLPPSSFTLHLSVSPIASLPTLASPTFLDMEDDKNIEMVAVDERNSSKEGSVENGVVKTAQTDAASEKGILDVCPIYDTN